MKGKNNIHKFPTDYHRRPKEVGGECQVQNKEGNSDLELIWRIRIKTLRHILMLGGGIFCVWLCILIIISISAGKESNFLSVFADTLKDLWIGIVSGATAVCGTTVAKKVRFAHYAGIFLCANLLFALFLCSLKWKAIDPDKTAENLALGGIVPTAIPVSTEVSEPEVVYPKERYSRDDDIFVEKLELYCGVEIGAIAEEYVAEKRADILAKDIETSKKIREGKTKSQLFWDNWHMADYMFRVYSKQRDIYDDDKNTSLKDNDKYLEDICNYRLSDLGEAIRYRILADEQYEDAENQKLLAQYFIGLADEYISQESYSLASENLQEGAKWAAKSIYNAIIEGDKDKMQKGMTELDNVINRLEKMGDTINEDAISMVKDGRDAYRVLIKRQ